jgi:hypothetical protein
VRRRSGRICKQLLNDLTEKRGYWKLKWTALDRTLRRTRLGRVYGPVVIQTTGRILGEGVAEQSAAEEISVQKVGGSGRLRIT